MRGHSPASGFVLFIILYLFMLLADSQLQLIEDYFKSRPVLKAYLFGSDAREEAGEESDVDILLDLDHSQRIGLQFVQMKLDLERL